MKVIISYIWNSVIMMWLILHILVGWCLQLKCWTNLHVIWMKQYMSRCGFLGQAGHQELQVKQQGKVLPGIPAEEAG